MLHGTWRTYVGRQAPPATMRCNKSCPGLLLHDWLERRGCRIAFRHYGISGHSGQAAPCALASRVMPSCVPITACPPPVTWTWSLSLWALLKRRIAAFYTSVSCGLPHASKKSLMSVYKGARVGSAALICMCATLLHSTHNGACDEAHTHVYVQTLAYTHKIRSPATEAAFPIHISHHPPHITQ